MDNSRLYQYRFDELLQIIRHGSKNTIVDERPENDQVIDICGNAFRAYQGIIWGNESWAIYTIEKIVKGLLEGKGFKYDIPEYEGKSPSGRMRKAHPFAFAMNEDGKYIAYCFLYRQRKSLREIREKVKLYDGIDGVKFYFLQNDATDSVKMLNDIEAKEDNSFLKFFVLKDLFDEKFGEEEYTSFMKYAESFNERAIVLIGYKTIPIPTDDAIKQFRKKKVEMLRDISEVSIFPEQVESNQKKIILNQLRQCDMYKVMVGYSNFADSFISSEWYYGIHTVTGAIDQTGLVTGYLKSIEQLLYALIRLSINKKRHIHINKKYKKCFKQKIYDDEFIDFTVDNEPYVDSTLGSLITFINYRNRNNPKDFYNRDLFVVNANTIQAIVDALRAFKDMERNDNFHEDNVYTREEIEEIRNKALSLYCLLLGSFKISQSDYAKLMVYDITEILPAAISEEELYEIIIKWATPILLFDMPKNTGTVAFHIIRLADERWELSLQGLHEIPEGKRETFEWNYHQTYTSSMTNNILEWKSGGKYSDEMNKLIGVLKQIVNEENAISQELKYYNEVVVGNSEVLEVLYAQ